MRNFFLLLYLAVLALSFPLIGKTDSYAQSEGGYGGRPPMFTPGPAQGPMVPVTPVPTSSTPPKAALSFAPVSMFGMNLYLAGLERLNQNITQLAQLSSAGGVKGAREELSWANVEPLRKGVTDDTAVGIFDRAIDLDVNNGMAVVGMLLTTPKWASTNLGVGDYYWYEPTNFNDYFDYVRWAVNRWKGKIHTWEIWNEPNHPGTWNCPNACNLPADYARLLAGAYSAVKSVDPNARVLIGGLYVHDVNNEGMAFLNRVVEASGGAINFDGLSIHTYMNDRMPESLRPDSLVQNFQYRLNMANDWIDAHGGRPSEIWITEDGRSTCTLSPSCPSNMTWSENDQASMLARMYGIALSTRRVVQFDYFQEEDKFNTPSNLYGGMSILRDDLSAKPAYYAYKTISGLLDGATFQGQGPLMVPGNDPNQPDNSDYVGFDYRFVQGSNNINMVWQVNGTALVDYPVSVPSVDVVARDGQVTHIATTGGKVRLQISPQPQYVVQTACTSPYSDVCPDFWAYSYIKCLSDRGVISGYPDGTFKPNNNITRAQLSKVVSNAAGFSETQTGQLFADIAVDSPFYQFVQRLASRGIISGYTCGGAGELCEAGNLPYFRPNSNTTRGQRAKIVANAKGYNDNPSGQTFEDVPPGSTFYPWVQRLASRNVMSGYACGGAGELCSDAGLAYFRPAVTATRAQVSKIVASTFYPECNP